MVKYNNAYWGGKRCHFYIGNKMVKKIYRGNTLIYQVGFDSFTVPAGVTNQQFVIPYNVSKIHIDCIASKGKDANTSAGLGGRVQCDLKVNGGDTLYFTTGLIPSSQNVASYNASDVRLNGTSLNDRIIVAGGGGSGVYNSGDDSRTSLTAGANGGGLTGASSSASPYWHGSVAGASGGTQTAGGTGSNSGAFGLGGNGSSNWAVGGAGGAGWYGGGGGVGSAAQHDGKRYRHGSGGGGGSSYTNANCSNVVHTQGFNNGNGYIVVSFVE